MKRRFNHGVLLLVLLLSAGAAWTEAPPAAEVSPEARIASIFVSEDLLNRLLQQYLHVALLQDVVIHLDVDKNQIEADGLAKIPTEELKAINVEQGLGDFRFQLAIRLKTTRQGHLLLIFPLDQTYFYPANSKHPDKDRIIIPVQLLSLALASARGYMAVLSGDFSGFDRQTAQLQQQIASIDQQWASTQDPDEREALKVDRTGLENQLAAIPIERKQGEKLAKRMQHVMGFVGEKEINLNQELAAHRNALVVRIQVGQLAPYLDGVELGGIRLRRDDREGAGENFMAMDLNGQVAVPQPPEVRTPHAPRPRTNQKAPDVMVRLNQAMFETKTMLDAEKTELGKRIKNFKLELEEDGIHVTGRWRLPILPDVPFTAIVDLVWTGPNVFEIRVRQVEFAHVELAALTRIVLEAAKNRIDQALKGACTFEYVGEEKDHSRAIRAKVNMAQVLPAFPGLDLTDIDVKKKEILLKVGEH